MGSILISLSEITTLLFQYAQFPFPALFFLFMAQNLPPPSILYNLLIVYYLSPRCSNHPSRMQTPWQSEELYLFCSIMYPNHLEEYVAHRRYLISICGLN